MNTFNAAVSRFATFLAEKVIYKVSDAFDKEVENSTEEAKEIIGRRLPSEMPTARAHNAESSTSKLGRLFYAFIQIFILNFCVSDSPKNAHIKAGNFTGGGFQCVYL